MNYNKVIIGGRLTREPELRYTPKGQAIAKLGAAVSRTWKNEAGEKKDEVCFIDIDCFGKQAETVSKYFKKGSAILVEGRLKLDQWEKDGHKHSKLKVVMEGFSFVDSRSQDTQKKSEEPQADSVDDDDVPF